ncbi:MAG: DMT family transporter [Clostridia bacterium]|nr:DMT family transporter [Clostridia bacterium]MBQ7306778.1 DMT family transporter [Clostridia bacterium]
MLGFLYALIAGAAMSFQGVMNTRLGDKVGVLETNAFVQLVGFVLALGIAIIFGKGDIRQLGQAPWYSWMGGVLAPVITVTVMLAIAGLSPTVAISTILLSQLTVAALIDAFGWLGSQQMPFTWQKLLGVGLMVGGVLLMKWKTA